MSCNRRPQSHIGKSLYNSTKSAIAGVFKRQTVEVTHLTV